MLATFIACSSLVGLLLHGATSTQTATAVVRDLGGSEISSIPTHPSLAIATTEAPTECPSHELRRRENVYTGKTLVQGNVSVIDSIGSICGYVTSDIRESCGQNLPSHID